MQSQQTDKGNGSAEDTWSGRAVKIVEMLGGKCSDTEFDEESKNHLAPSFTIAGWGNMFAMERNNWILACQLAIAGGMLKRNQENTGYVLVDKPQRQG